MRVMRSLQSPLRKTRAVVCFIHRQLLHIHISDYIHNTGLLRSWLGTIMPVTCAFSCHV